MVDMDGHPREHWEPSQSPAFPQLTERFTPMATATDVLIIAGAVPAAWLISAALDKFAATMERLYPMTNPFNTTADPQTTADFWDGYTTAAAASDPWQSDASGLVDLASIPPMTDDEIAELDSYITDGDADGFLADFDPYDDYAEPWSADQAEHDTIHALLYGGTVDDFDPWADDDRAGL